MRLSLRSEGARALLACSALVGLLAGCEAPAPAKPTPPAASAPSVQTDTCAEQLHDICGRLLLYYSAHKELPDTLTRLSKPDNPLPLTCPSSGKPYVYNRAGLAVPGWTGRLIVYDAGPYHYGSEWGILAEPPAPGRPLVARVVRFAMWQGQPAIKSERALDARAAKTLSRGRPGAE